MKDLINNNYKTNDTKINDTKINDTKINNSNNHSYLVNNNIHFNQNEVPCFNNINIFTSNMNNYKGSGVDIKQMINKKLTKTRENSKKKLSNVRSVSNIIK